MFLVNRYIRILHHRRTTALIGVSSMDQIKEIRRKLIEEKPVFP